MFGNKYPYIASGATLIGSADRTPDRKYFRAAIVKDGKSSSPLLGGKHQKHRLVIYFHQERQLRTQQKYLIT